MERRAKIVATLGPATSDAKVLEKLLDAGADVLRINLSHGSTEEHRATIRRVRRVAGRLNLQVPLLLDLMGPRFRLGTLDEPRALRKGERLILGGGEDADLPVDDPAFLRRLKSGERVLIADGLVELRVTAKRGARVTAKVVAGGTVSTRKGINLPDSKIPFTISDRDRAGIALAVEEKVEYLGASYVGHPRDVEALRTVLRDLGDEIPIVAKLERPAAVEHLDAIVEAADAIMVARGDLGVEIPLHEVPVLQKRMVAAGRRLGKPVIVATQMLESMMTHPRPTRAESSDVANAVLDGADAVMLSGETAVGDYPVETVETMARIIIEAETYRQEEAREGVLPASEEPLPGTFESQPSKRHGRAAAEEGAIAIADVIAAAAVYAASKLPRARIVAFSQGGFTARRLARYRPAVPAFVLTPDARVARRIQLLWGTTPVHLTGAGARKLEKRTDFATIVEQDLLGRHLLHPGDCLILLMGSPVESNPLTNLLRIHRVAKR
jgi:pyruvate kinase